MPTGTGKTETMLSLLITAQPECMLVVVPSKALRDQTARKFATLGILPVHGLLHDSARLPIVGVPEHQIGSEEALELFERCNVVVGVIDSIAMGKAKEFLEQIAQRCSHLVLDEAHHVAASSWTELKKAFAAKPVVQFTATPFRADRSALGGKQIYNYPLRRAQDDGYFVERRMMAISSQSASRVSSRWIRSPRIAGSRRKPWSSSGTIFAMASTIVCWPGVEPKTEPKR
jgi:superfamily II DNA or RNA helicase